jgi:hypothetical protein
MRGPRWKRGFDEGPPDRLNAARATISNLARTVAAAKTKL